MSNDEKGNFNDIFDTPPFDGGCLKEDVSEESNSILYLSELDDLSDHEEFKKNKKSLLKHQIKIFNRSHQNQKKVKL